MKIFATGLNGLVGSRLSEVLSSRHTFTNLSRTTGVDITDPKTLDVISNDTEHNLLIHLAAKADVDGSEKDKELGKEGEAYKINVTGTANVVEACKRGNKKIVYVSTDFVFDGVNTPEGGYTENDTPNPVNWYAQTKYDGEKVVRESGIPYLILRIAYPYRSGIGPAKKDFVHAMLGRLLSGQGLTGVIDQQITPTFIDDFSNAFDQLIQQERTGIYHVVGSQSLSPYEAALAIAEKFECDTSLITEITNEVFNAGKAPRPANLTISNKKIKELGIEMRSFKDVLQTLE